MSERTDLMNELYDAAFITMGAVAVSLVSKKAFGDNLGINATTKGVIKLTAAIGAGSLAVQYLQEKKLLPDDPFK